ncbi:MAG: alpha-L-arabinofuranosidase C-terminal domain-containing protein, partial [bacterium]
ETCWYKTLYKALYMEELIRRHGEIMDRFDPEKKIGLSVDEWGSWYTSEPGTNPGFLYQQNTVRDALIAAITLNIFNQHCDRVKMACLAQMVNVLQAVILTEGEKMLKTPTYHVMHMYRCHQGAELVGSQLVGEKKVGKGQWRMPQITQSVSRSADGTLNVTLGNLSAQDAEKLTLTFSGKRTVTEARIVNGEALQSYNSFEAPETVTEAPFAEYETKGKNVTLTLPAHSVLLLRLK